MHLKCERPVRVSAPNFLGLFYSRAKKKPTVPKEEFGATRFWHHERKQPPGPSVVSLNYVIITSAAASASLARWIFSRIFRPDARQTYFFGFWLRSAR